MRTRPTSSLRVWSLFAPQSSLLLAFGVCRSSLAVDAFAGAVGDRMAVERVYYSHRLGDKPPFEVALPRETLEGLVREDRLKEVVLKKVYGVEITPAFLDEEVQRIDITTRAPDVLGELKAALDNDRQRFAQAVARPILIERTLRERFDNDESLHADGRQRADALRNRLLALTPEATKPRWEMLKECGKESAQEVTWQLAPPPRPEASVATVPTGPLEMTQGKSRSSNYAVDSDAQVVQVVHSGSSNHHQDTLYFDDLPPQLREVLSAQLQQSGNVSAVIETARGFLVFVAKERTPNALSVVSICIPKANYETWLAAQTKDAP